MLIKMVNIYCNNLYKHKDMMCSVSLGIWNIFKILELQFVIPQMFVNYHNLYMFDDFIVHLK